MKNTKQPWPLEISPAEFISYPDNPRARNAEARSKSARHLRAKSPAHRYVFAAVLPDGTCIKLDGHTRAYNWEKEITEPPITAWCVYIPVQSETEAGALREHFDSPAAVRPQEVTLDIKRAS
ncbi:MAG: hypothetical protein JNM30_13265 [Rhodospirillales bacterium]|nr:hypothetical protein [Rhodospirillales bacterium]